MSCAACASRVEKALSAVPGVASATVNFALARADVTFDPSTVAHGRPRRSDPGRRLWRRNHPGQSRYRRHDLRQLRGPRGSGVAGRTRRRLGGGEPGHGAGRRGSVRPAFGHRPSRRRGAKGGLRRHAQNRRRRRPPRPGSRPRGRAAKGRPSRPVRLVRFGGSHLAAGGADGGHGGRPSDVSAALCRTRAGHPGAVLGGGAVLSRRVGRHQGTLGQHGSAGGDGNQRRLSVQPRHADAAGRRGGGTSLFRGRGRDHHPGARRQVAGNPGETGHHRRHPRADGAPAGNRAGGARRRRRPRSPSPMWSGATW